MGSLFSAIVPLLLSLIVLFGYVMEMEAREICPGDYWKSVMHNQPIPKSIAELLIINGEFSSSSSTSEPHHHHRRRHDNVSMIKQKKIQVSSPALAASDETALNTKRFSRTFDTSPNVIIYHSRVIIN